MLQREVTRPRQPFQRLSREVLVDHRWHRYCRDRYTHRDCSEGEYHYIDMVGSAATVPMFDDGTVALVRVHRYLFGRDLWEFPIGGIDAGDDPLLAAQKELRQEAGLLAGEWHKLGQFAPYKGGSNEITHFYLARQLTQTEQQLETSEDISVHRLPLAEARRRIVDQEIGDGQSMAGLLLLERFMQGLDQ